MKYIEFDLDKHCGLTNKIFNLIYLTSICINNNINIIEPLFGWKKKIPFSDIYNIDILNNAFMNIYNRKIIYKKSDIKNITDVTKIDLNKIKKYIKNENTNIFIKKYNNKNILYVKFFRIVDFEHFFISNLRKNMRLNKFHPYLVIFNNLKLNLKLYKIMKNFNKDNTVSIHIRLESDLVKWFNERRYRKNWHLKEQQYFIGIEDIINKMDRKRLTNNVFFTTGENQEKFKNAFIKNNYKAEYFFDNKLEYEQNAAINFEICSSTKYFIGTCMSTYSNAISTVRFIKNINNSFIYNHNEIRKRIDAGIQCNKDECIKRKIIIL